MAEPPRREPATQRPKQAPVGARGGPSLDEPPPAWVPPVRESPRPAPASPDGSRRSGPRAGPVILAVLLLVVGAAAVGFVAGRATNRGAVGFVTIDADRLTDLEELAERRAREIQRLQERLDAAAEAPTAGEYRTALESCDTAFALLIDREASLFGDRDALRRFVDMANRCLAPTGRQIRTPG